MKLTIMFSAILSLGRFGDHVLLFSGSTAMMLVFQASCSQISCDFFHPTDRPTQNQETYSTLNERKGDDLSLMVSFWASSPHCFCVFLYTCLLFCSFFVGEITETETVQTPSIFPLEILEKKKWKTRWFIDLKGNEVGLGLVKVLTWISWNPVCCRYMFHKNLATAMEYAATLSTVWEIMYFTKTKRSYFRFAPPPTPESPRQDRFKVLPTPRPKWLDLFLWLPGG